MTTTTKSMMTMNQQHQMIFCANEQELLVRP
jgi:hypothetical protein